MRSRGLGRTYQPSYNDKGTGELKHGSIWWIEFSRNGKLHRESSKSRKRSDARKLLKTRLGEAGIGKLLPSEVANTTFADLKALITTDYAKNDHRTQDQLEIVLGRLDEGFAGMKAVEITPVRINAYQAQQKQDGYANATINRDMAALKRMFRLGLRLGVVQQVPHIQMLQEDNVRTGFFEPEEFRTLVRHLPEPLQPLFIIAYITGWRTKSELLTRRWVDVDFVNRRLRLQPGEDKNRSGREFPFTPELQTILHQQRKRATRIEQGRGGAEVASVFFWDDGTPILSYRKGWADAVKASGAARIPHDFRRTAVRNLELASVPRSAAMKMVGHKTESIYRRYAIVDEGMMQDAVAKLAALHTLQRKKPSPRTKRLRSS